MGVSSGGGRPHPPEAGKVYGVIVYFIPFISPIPTCK